MNPLKRLAGETVLYGASSVLGRFLNYLLFPLHTLVFPTGEYGIITELYVYAAFLNIIYLYGLETAYFRFASSNKDDESTIFNTGITAVLLSSLFFTLLLVAFATPIVDWMGYNGKEHFVYMFAAILGFDAFFALPFAQLRKRGKARRFAAAKLFGIALNIGINLFFLGFCYTIYADFPDSGMKEFVNSVYRPDYHLEYVFAANLVGSFGVVLFLFPQLRTIRFKIHRKYFQKMFLYGYPLLFSGLALVTNEMLSRAALKYWLPENFYPGFSSQEILGIFGGVFKLAVIMNLGIQAYRYAAEPFFFNQSEKSDSPQLFSKLLTWFTIAACIIWVAVSFNLGLLQYLLRNPDYRLAMDVVPFLLLVSLLMGINYNLSAWYKLVDLTKVGTLITVIGALITLVGNYLLIPVYGYMGSAFAGILAYGTMCIISYIWSRKRNPIPYSVTKIFIYLVISALIIYAGSYIQFEKLLYELLLKNGIIFLMIIVIYKAERINLRQINP